MQSVVGTVVGIVQLRDSPYFLTIGEDPKGFTLERYRLIDGDPIAGKRQIMLGALTARNFKKMVGDKFGINEATYTVQSASPSSLLTVLGLEAPSIRTLPSAPQSNLSTASRPLLSPTLVRMASVHSWMFMVFLAGW